MLSLLQTLLEIEGYEVFQSVEFDDAASRISEVKPDLIIMDVNLQSANGLDVLQAVRSDEELANTLVIMSSGMDLQNECMEKGADDFILKPYMPDELVRKIEGLLQVRDAHQKTN